MGWLVSYTLASIAAAYVVVKIFDYLFTGIAGGFAGSVRAGLFILTWTLVTAQAGMQGVTKKVQQVKQGFLKRFLV